MAANQIALLHPNGIMLTLGTFADVVRNFLVGNKLVELEPAFIEIGVKQWYWNYRGPRDDHPLGVPAVYVTDEPSWRPALMAAWRSSDEGMADAALARVLEREVTGWAMFELLHYLASPAAAEIPSEIRATYVDQLYRIANRRLPKLVPDLDIRKVRIALTKGELAPEQLAPLAALIEAPSGIFIGDYDATTPLSSRSWPMRLPTTPRASCTRITSRRTARSSARKRFAPTPRA